MPYSKTPQISTYQTKMVSLVDEIYNRNLTPSKDIDFLNVFFELRQNKALGISEVFPVKRDGTALYIPSFGSNIRGIYYNNDFKKIYYAVDSNLIVWDYNTSTLSTNIAGFFGTTTGDVGFIDYLYDNGNQAIVISDGASLKLIDNTNTVTTCTDPDLPLPHQPYPIFLDGYLFLLKTGTSDLYNSDLNDPMSWTAGNFISAEILPDQAKRPAKINNYIIVFGSDSIEYFWDAGNTTGSPLQRNDTPVKFNGYLGGYAQFGNKIYFVGNNDFGQPDIFVLEDLKIDPIGSSTLSRYLSYQTTTYANYTGAIVGMNGHTFYVLNAGQYTYVMDVDTKFWYRWAFQQQDGFYIGNAVNIHNSSSYTCFFYLKGNGAIYSFDARVYQDIGTKFTCAGTTPNQEFDTFQQKVMNLITVWADRPNTDCYLNLSWSDDDYKTFTTPRAINLNQERPSIDRLGRFRRRAFKWTFTENQPIRFKALEVKLNIGQT